MREAVFVMARKLHCLYSVVINVNPISTASPNIICTYAKKQHAFSVESEGAVELPFNIIGMSFLFSYHIIPLIRAHLQH
jgi:hypothetical protein